MLFIGVPMAILGGLRLLLTLNFKIIKVYKMKYSLLLLSIFLVTPAYSMPSSITNEKAHDKTITVDIASDLPPPASAEQVVPTHPFFSESVANELMEKVQELQERIEKLEKAMPASAKGK